MQELGVSEGSDQNNNTPMCNLLVIKNRDDHIWKKNDDGEGLERSAPNETYILKNNPPSWTL